jgi:hypothetical protein
MPVNRAIRIATYNAPVNCSTMHIARAWRVFGAMSPNPVLVSTVQLK